MIKSFTALRCISLSLFLTISTAGLAQEQDIEQPAKAEQASADKSANSATAAGSDEKRINVSAGQPIQEITVSGRQTLLSLKNQIERVEDSLYSMFNDLNSNDEFDILCKTERSTNSYIPQRACEPAFFIDLRQVTSRHAVAEMRQAFTETGVDEAILANSMDYIIPDGELRQQSGQKFEQLNEEIFKVASENPEYLRLLENLGEMKSNLESERKKNFEK